MKKQIACLFCVMVLMVMLSTACQPENDLPVITMASPTPDISGSKEISTVEAINPQKLLAAAINKFKTASSFEMRTHEITSYKAIIADGTSRIIYGEFNSIYDFHRRPELKVRIQTDFRYSPDSVFTSETYYLFEREEVAYSARVDEGGIAIVEETGGQSVEKLIGDAYQAIFRFGEEAQFLYRDDDDLVYLLEPPNWYSLTGAVRFADLGLLLAQPNGEALVQDYAEEAYPDVQPSQFVLHISVTGQTITSIDVSNQDLMLSFWEAYDQALVAQGVEPEELTRYEIQSDHGSEILIDLYDQAPDFNIPD